MKYLLFQSRYGGTSVNEYDDIDTLKRDATEVIKQGGTIRAATEIPLKINVTVEVDDTQ